MAYGSISRCVRARGVSSPSRIGVLTVMTQSWEGAFRHFDKNGNNAIDGDELELALERFGYNLSPQLQDLLKRKYGATLSVLLSIQSLLLFTLVRLDVPWAYKEVTEGTDPAIADSRSAPPGITFDRFMRACVVVKQLKESFEALDRDPLGRVKINYEQFLEMVFKLP